MARYFVEKNPLAAIGGCDGLPAYLEQKLSAGQELVAVVEYAGTPHWIFRLSQATKQEPAAKREPPARQE